MAHIFTAVPDSDVVVIQHRWTTGETLSTVVLRDVSRFVIRRDTVHFSTYSKQDHSVLVHCGARKDDSVREFHFETEDEAGDFAVSLRSALGWTS